MKRVNNAVLLAVALAALPMRASLAQRTPEPADALLRAARQQAQARQRPILVLFRASW